MDEPFITVLYNTNGNLFGQWAHFYFDSLPYPVPAYYDAQIAERAADINTIALGLQRQSTRFFFITDYHMASNANHSPALINALINKTGIKRVIFGGDAFNAEDTQSAALNDLLAFVDLFNPMSAYSDVFCITGNHEYNNPSSIPDYTSRMLPMDTLYQVFNAPIRNIVALDGTNTFYIDDPQTKIRTYCIDCEATSSISTAARHGVMKSLENVPDGYAVLFVSHKGLSNDNSEIYSRMYQLMSAGAALNDGVPYTFTYTDIGEQTYDYTGKNCTFIGAITGHTHQDGYVYYDGRFPVIATACDAYAAQTAHPERVAGTVLEQCFEVVQIDVSQKRIYLTRIGYGDSRTFSFGAAGSGLITA